MKREAYKIIIAVLLSLIVVLLGVVIFLLLKKEPADTATKYSTEYRG